MSSLLQFSGKMGHRGVQLQAYRVERAWKCGSFSYRRNLFPDASPYTVTIRTWSYADHETETEACPQCGREHPKLYGFWRKPRGMFGCWVIFQYNGEKRIPDLSVPIQMQKLPRDARPLPIIVWHD